MRSTPPQLLLCPNPQACYDRSMSIASQSFERILLIKPSAVGDVVHTLPVLAKLRQRYPDAQIDWLIRPEIADLVRSHPALSNVVLFDRRGLARFGRNWTATVGLFRLLSQIRRERYELVVDLHGQLRSALFTLASRAPFRVGFERTREGAWVSYSHHIPLPTMEAHAVDRYLWLGLVLGFDATAPDFTIHLPAETDENVARLLADRRQLGRPLAVLVPGTVWETKHWRTEGFAEVARQLLARGYAVVLAGSPKDRPRCRQVAEVASGVCDLSGQTTLAEMVALIRRATLCVTNDSGSMHVAVALDKPVVSVFGPTNPLRTGPYGRPLAVVQAKVECSPCYLRKLSRCPHGHLCMQQVSPAMVLERLSHLQSEAA
ncbi:MAG TPA: lipopolysaccharide heptosyltransferase II [Pirellulales bacterium]|nr:lipopolysaccharide heptosyltransferase II [Pirellulales bacterium]